MKKHEHEHKSIFTRQWAKRYVTVNTTRGTLSVGKSQTDPKPKTILPLCDITLVKELEGSHVDWSDGSFTISCPPLHVTLQAEDMDERKRWVTKIRESVAEWKNQDKLQEKARKSGVPCAVAELSELSVGSSYGGQPSLRSSFASPQPSPAVRAGCRSGSPLVR